MILPVIRPFYKCGKLFLFDSHMNFFQNYPIFIPFIAILSAEVVKFLVDVIRQRDKKRFLSSGGMPSGHSSFVTSLALVVAHREGIESTDFMIAAVLAIIVMYDAIHVRNEAGKHAAMLNKNFPPQLNEILLEESLGHTHWEVLGGAMWGTLVSFLLLMI